MPFGDPGGYAQGPLSFAPDMPQSPMMPFSRKDDLMRRGRGLQPGASLAQLLAFLSGPGGNNGGVIGGPPPPPPSAVPPTFGTPPPVGGSGRTYGNRPGVFPYS